MLKSYRQQQCPVARTIDLIGDRWTIPVLRDLFLHGPRRFQDLQESLVGVAPNTLSSRLKAMEGSGLIARQQYSEHPPGSRSPHRQGQEPGPDRQGAPRLGAEAHLDEETVRAAHLILAIQEQHHSM